MIKPVKGGFKVFSHKTGKALSKRYHSKLGALRRLAQIRYFKHRSR